MTWMSQESERPVRFGKGESRDGLLELGATLLDSYLEEPPPERIIGVEEEMIVPLYTSNGRLLDAPMIAVLDLVCRSEDGLAVVEFKTSKRRYSETELESALQATCYVNAVQERYGEAVSLNYVVLVKTKKPQVQRLSTERTQKDIGRLGDIVQTIQTAIQENVFYPNENPMNCSGCAFRKQCRDWQGNRPRKELTTNDGVSRVS